MITKLEIHFLGLGVFATHEHDRNGNPLHFFAAKAPNFKYPRLPEHTPLLTFYVDDFCSENPDPSVQANINFTLPNLPDPDRGDDGDFTTDMAAWNVADCRLQVLPGGHQLTAGDCDWNLDNLPHFGDMDPTWGVLHKRCRTRPKWQRVTTHVALPCGETETQDLSELELHFCDPHTGNPRLPGKKYNQRVVYTLPELKVESVTFRAERFKGGSVDLTLKTKQSTLRVALSNYPSLPVNPHHLVTLFELCKEPPKPKDRPVPVLGKPCHGNTSWDEIDYPIEFLRPRTGGCPPTGGTYE